MISFSRLSGPDPVCTPLVSVIVPAHNAADHIRETLESVLCQSHTNLEVIVVDDGSTDATAGIVEATAAGDDRVCLLRQANSGVAAARNHGIRESSGELIATLDADDLWSPFKIEKQVACLMSAGPRAGLAYCWTLGIDEDGFVIYAAGRPQAQGEVFRRHLRGNFIGNGSVPLIRRHCLRSVGDYRTELRARGGQGCEDWDLTLRIAEQFEFCVVPDFLVGYRRVGGSMSWNHDAMQKSYELMIQDLQCRRKLPARDLRASRCAFLLYLIRYRLRGRRYLSVVQGLMHASLLHPGLVLQDILLTLQGRLRRLLYHLQGVNRRRQRPFQQTRDGKSMASQAVLSVET